MKEEQNFNFTGVLNGVEYENPEEFINAVRKATEEGSVKSLTYHYTSLSGTDDRPSDYKKEKSFDKQNQKPDGFNSHCADTVDRVSKIRDIVEEVVDIAEDIADSDTFSSDKLSTVADRLVSSFDKIEYLICGMRAEDREDFRSKMLDAMKQMFDEVDSDHKDLVYEEAKFRQELTDTNAEIEDEIERLEKKINENTREISESHNRCSASEYLRDFFSNMVDLLEIR